MQENILPTFPARAARFRSQKGLTLVEIIVVLAILSLLFGWLTGALAGQGDKAKARMNELQMKKVQSSINQYQLMYNNLPSDLAALTNCGNKGGSCIPIADADELNDIWGTPLQYATRDGGRSYVIKSLGADKREGGSGVEGDFEVVGP